MIISPDFVAYEQKCAAVSALRADALPLNKSALFDALAAAAIQTVVIEFDGCGDSGQPKTSPASAPRIRKFLCQTMKSRCTRCSLKAPAFRL